jgi:hypothetical protein
MLRLLMIVSGGVEAAFGAWILIVPLVVIGILLGTEADASALALARLLGAATLALGIAALLARDALRSGGGLAAAYGLALYNVPAAFLIFWTASVAGLGGGALWGAGLFHAAMGALFVYALASRRGAPTAN